MSINMSDLTVEHQASQNRFAIEVNGKTSVAEYRRNGDTITFTHTFVPPQQRNNGIASNLAKAALDYAKEEQLTVVPQCPFFKTYIDNNPEYKSLI